MNNLTRIQVLVVVMVIVAAVLIYKSWDGPKPLAVFNAQGVLEDEVANIQAVEHHEAVSPIQKADRRITKKPFGIYITKINSPVQPERFIGYHTGTDFETLPVEENVQVPFYAICAGKILVKGAASGYGGVLVQSCYINNQPATVVYGHISVGSVEKKIGNTLLQGELIGNLGQSPDETDGERKHLHLGIHKGTTVNITGYVQRSSDLNSWLDWAKLDK